MAYTVQFDSGHSVDFEQQPTPEMIEQVASQLHNQQTQHQGGLLANTVGVVGKAATNALSSIGGGASMVAGAVASPFSESLSDKFYAGAHRENTGKGGISKFGNDLLDKTGLQPTGLGAKAANLGGALATFVNPISAALGMGGGAGQQMEQLNQEGVDGDTATRIAQGNLVGGAVAGAVLPGIAGVGMRGAVGGMVAQGVATRGATNAYLRSQGYNDAADNQAGAFDFGSMAEDAILGGAAHHFFGDRPTPPEKPGESSPWSPQQGQLFSPEDVPVPSKAESRDPNTAPEEAGPGSNAGRWYQQFGTPEERAARPEEWNVDRSGKQRGNQENLFTDDEAPKPHDLTAGGEGMANEGGPDNSPDAMRERGEQQHPPSDVKSDRPTMFTGRELTPEERMLQGDFSGILPNRETPRAGSLDGKLFYDTRPGEDISHLLQDTSAPQTKLMDPHEALDFISKSSQTPMWAKVGANVLKRFNSPLNSLNILVHKGHFDGYASADGDRGFYDPVTHTIRLGEHYVQSGVVLHEMWHAVTSRAMKVSEAHPGEFPILDRMTNQMKDILQQVKKMGWQSDSVDQHGQPSINWKFDEMPEVRRGPIYGLTNHHEMVSEVWSNAGFRDLLGRLNVLDKIKSAISRAFNMPKDALSQVMDLSEKIAKYSDENWDAIRESAARVVQESDARKINTPNKIIADALGKSSMTKDPHVVAITKGLPGGKNLSEKHIAAMPKPEDVIAETLKAPDLEGSFGEKVMRNLTVSGEQLANLLRSKGFYLYTRIFDRAQTMSQYHEETVIKPLREQIKQIIPDSNWNSLKNVKDLMIKEDLSNQRMPDKVAKLNPQEQQVYKLLRDALDKQMAHVNAARVRNGMEPITPRAAYMASHWSGPYGVEVREVVRDSKGAIVKDAEGNEVTKFTGYINGHSKAEVRKGTDWVSKQNDMRVDPKKIAYKNQFDNRRNPVQDYRDLVKMLGENDPGVQAIGRALQAHAEKEGANVEDYAKHFEEKHGARFFEGDREWADPRKETQAWFRNQLDTMHDGYKWSSMQDAVSVHKKIVSNPSMLKQRPEMLNLMKEFARNQMGYGKADSVSKFENAFYKTMGEIFDIVPGLRNVPIDMRTGMAIMRTSKNMIYLKALGFWKPQHFLVNGVFQPAFTMPRHMKMSAEGYSHNPLTTFVRGGRDAAAILLHHYTNGKGPELSEFAQNAKDYIDTNGIATNNPYSDVGELGRGKLDAALKKSQAIGGYFMQEGERVARINAFMSFSHHLEQSGKFTDRNELFQEAKRNTTEVMGSFKHTDRPLAFVKSGITGTGLATLRQFEINFINQFHDYCKYAHETKNYGPLAAFSAIQLSFAGVMGFIGFDTADSIWKWLRDLLPTSMVSKEFAQWSPKAAAMKDLPELLSRGMVSPMTGINFASSLDSGTILDPSIEGLFPFISEIKNTIGPAFDYVTNPTSDNLHKMVWNETPYGSRGMLETGKFAGMDVPDAMNTKSWYTSPSGVSNSPNTPGKGVYKRTDEDTNIRSWGFTSTNEAMHKQAQYMTDEDTKELQTRQKDAMDGIMSSVRNMQPGDIRGYMKQYIEMGGDPRKALSNQTFKKMIMDWNTDYAQKTQLALRSGDLQAINKLRLMNSYMQQIGGAR